MSADSEKINFFETPTRTDYSFGEGLSAQVAYDNFLVNNVWKISDHFLTQSEVKELNGQPYNSLSKENRSKWDAKYWPIVADKKTEGQAARAVYKAQQEEQYKHIIENSSIKSGIAGGFYNAFTSPWTLLPMARLIAAPTIGGSFLKGAAKSVPALAAGSAIEEANLLWAQETRKIEDSAANVAFSTFLGAVLGGGANAFKTVKFGMYKDLLKHSFDGADVKFNISKKGEIDGFNVINEQKSTFIPLEGEKLMGLGKDFMPTPAKPFVWFTAKMLRNPVLRGLTSKSKTVSKFIDDAYEHNFDVVSRGAREGYRETSLQTLIDNYRGEATRSSLDLIDSYYDYIGLNPDGSRFANLAVDTVKPKGDLLSFDDYLKESYRAIVKNGESDIPQAAAFAKKTIAGFIDKNTEKLVKQGIFSSNVAPFGADKHLLRLHDKEGIIGDKPNKIAKLAEKFSETNQKVIEETNALSELTKQYQAATFAWGKNRSDPKLKKNRESLKNRLNAERERIENNILSGKYPREMLVGDAGMKLEQLETVKKLREPINKIKEEIDTLKSEFSAAETTEKARGIKEKIKNKKDELKSLRDEYNTKFNTGELDQGIGFKTSKGEWRLKKPNKGTQKLRPVMTAQQLHNSAESAIENILGMSEEQMGEALVKGLKSGSSGDPLMPRSLLVNDEWLLDNGFLVPDPRKSLEAYSLRIGRIIEMDKYFKKRGWDGNGNGIDFIAKGIKEDYGALEQGLNKSFQKRMEGKTGAELDSLKKKVGKKRLKLHKKMESDLELASITYGRLTGNQPKSAAGLIRLSRFLNQWAYGSQLGGLGLMTLQDVVAPMFRGGPLSYMVDGVQPFVRGIFRTGNKGSKRFREAAIDYGAGLETLQAFQSQRFDLSKEYELPMNYIERGVKGAADAMGVLSGSTAITDFAKVIGSTATASRLSRMIRRHAEGKLKPNSLAFQQMKVLRLEDPNMLKRINKQLYGADGKSGFAEKLNGAWLPNIENWTDPGAALAFRSAIKHELNSVIFSGKNIGSYPLELEYSGFANSLLMYMGYSFNATANYLIPTLQRADFNKVFGLATMASVAMLVNPLRQAAEGKDVDLDPANLAMGGIINSGALGTPLDLFNKTNSAFEFMPDLISERYVDKGKLELLSGAPGSFFNAVGLTVALFTSGEWNKKDLKTIKRNIPLLNVIWARKFINDWIDNLDLPETRSKARKEKD